jgi:hypothetical protein
MRHSSTIAHLSTLENAGYPFVIPIWLLWKDNAFNIASDTPRAGLTSAVNDNRAGVVIDTEAALRPDGELPNQQVRAIGHATVEPDTRSRLPARPDRCAAGHLPGVWGQRNASSGDCGVMPRDLCRVRTRAGLRRQGLNIMSPAC